MLNVGIVDYGCGNIRSVSQAFEYLGYQVGLIHSAKNNADKYSHLILPGVGAFSEASENLVRRGLKKMLLTEIAKGKPVLGICVGMQLLFDEGFEFGRHQGLGAITGSVRHLNDFSPSAQTPKTGWAPIHFREETPFFGGLDIEESFYFNHSYACLPEDPNAVSAYCVGDNWPSAIIKQNVWGIQAHPEKSQKAGLSFLGQFLRRSS
ncbi:imidazole glycerol phosphate synthase subunit HisH [Thalassospira sp. MIT1370]|uniref:imidazole glycerol phosphate synthase subunit HisH n=1 Tax=unclassified Thalassospira TaxID=2648997 RepID=UPI00399A7FFE